ncbi:hypothetical protein [uncultured Lacinutrix sp.]|uniref:hypothetical protein n=1 Tax=uncultured Lacinutrix sp. TaxID=574032 RepID=UPI0026223F55|nr:hypothetical protein [uncultured Lacinutrix sp.]
MSRKKWPSKKIFNRLLNNKTQKTYWDNISELRRRPNQSVFDEAYKLAKSNIDKQKIIGLHILQQLGFEPRYNKKQTVELHFKLLEKTQSDNVLKSIFHGIGHNNDELNDKQVSKLVEFQNVKNIDVKHALISALSGIEHSKAINVLIIFMKDKVSSIRNWATFGIGSLIESDNKEIRNALWNRVTDNHFETKSEAIVGLANRKDKQIKNIIISELKKGDYGTLLFEAILTIKDKDFLPLLNSNLEIAKKDKNDIKNGWVLALEETINELKK